MMQREQAAEAMTSASGASPNEAIRATILIAALHGRFYDASLRADVPSPTSRGLRWLSAMVLVDVPFAGRIWAELAKVPAAQRLECQRRGCRC